MTVKLPPGTPLAETDALVRSLQEQHDGDDGIRTLYAVSGTGTRLDANRPKAARTSASLTVIMADGGSKKIEARETESLRKGMQGPHRRAGRFQPPAAVQPVDAAGNRTQRPGPTDHRTRGPEAGAAAARQSALRRRQVLGGAGLPEIQIRFDQQRAGALGLTTRQIADVVVNKVAGDVATRYSFRDRKIDVLVRAQTDQRSSVEDIKRLIVNPGGGNPVTLDSVADVVQTTGPSEIHRADQVRGPGLGQPARHRPRHRGARGERDGAAEPARRRRAPAHRRRGEELGESVRSLLFAFGLAVFLVYLVMASQFESLLHPFVILFTIPLAMVGAVLALLLTRSPVSAVVFIGLILLVGLVVKNAIILIDKVNQLRETGVRKREALVEGARSRLRPIMMTTLCTLFGFLPLALAFGEGAEVRSPMAITVIGGLLVSTLLTLVVIPVVYDLLDRKPDEYYAERGRRARHDAEEVAEGLRHEGDALGEPGGAA